MEDSSQWVVTGEPVTQAAHTGYRAQWRENNGTSPHKQLLRTEAGVCVAEVCLPECGRISLL